MRPLPLLCLVALIGCADGGGEKLDTPPSTVADGTALSEPAKALATGGRIGVHAADVLDVGVSALVGSWQPEVWAPLIAADIDASIAWKGLSVRSEALWVRKGSEATTTTRYGYFVQTAYLVPGTPLEPAVQLDQLLGGEAAAENPITWTGGINLYPLHRVTRKVVVKANVEHEVAEASTQTFLLQLGAGF